MSTTISCYSIRKLRYNISLLNKVLVYTCAFNYTCTQSFPYVVINGYESHKLSKENISPLTTAGEPRKLRA